MLKREFLLRGGDGSSEAKAVEVFSVKESRLLAAGGVARLISCFIDDLYSAEVGSDDLETIQQGCAAIELILSER